MSGGGSVNFQTPTPLYEAENQIFGNLPLNNTNNAANLAYQGFTNLTDPNGLGAFQGNVAGTGNNLVNMVPGLANQGSSLYGTGNSVLGNLFNNQQGYYNQLQQQNQDQSNAENAMSGVAGTPYGSALTNQSNLNFNNQWQSFLNNQQNTVANTANTLFGAGNNAYNTAGNLFGVGAGGIQQNANNTQTQAQDYLNYLLANTQNSSAYTNAVNNSTNAGAASTNSLANAEQANNAGKSGLGSALGSIGGLVGKLATGGVL